MKHTQSSSPLQSVNNTVVHREFPFRRNSLSEHSSSAPQRTLPTSTTSVSLSRSALYPLLLSFTASHYSSILLSVTGNLFLPDPPFLSFPLLFQGPEEQIKYLSAQERDKKARGKSSNCHVFLPIYIMLWGMTSIKMVWCEVTYLKAYGLNPENTWWKMTSAGTIVCNIQQSVIYSSVLEHSP